MFPSLNNHNKFSLLAYSYEWVNRIRMDKMDKLNMNLFGFDAFKENKFLFNAQARENGRDDEPRGQRDN